MASRGVEMGLILVLMGMLWAAANAQSCIPAPTNLAPCLNYITGNSSSPSSTCCSQIKSVVQSSPQCLCTVLNSGASLGFTINQTVALQLPGACQVQMPSISQCNGNGGTSGTPSAAPTASPTGSPSDSSDVTPDGDITPSASEFPSGTGSKTVPSTTDGRSSDASISKTSLHLVLFLLFIGTVNKF